ncbi:MAG: DUF58 domain-containing protein [bacterium]|nr:DUF58 domain-containing protein [bacterium]
MIVPRSRLLLMVGVIVLPFALLAGVQPDVVPLAIAAIGVLVIVALLDAALAHGSLNGIGASLPEVVRLSKDRDGEIDIQITNDRPSAKRLRLGLALPHEIESAEQDMHVSLAAGSGDGASVYRVAWPCRPLRRGRYTFHNVYLEGVSPLGLWGVRATAPAECEARVYPNLMTERRQVAAIFLNRAGFGIHAQRQLGKGREFEKLREYVPGDSFDEIHWKATAKRGHPITKVFQLERTQEVYVVVDASRLSGRTVRVPDGNGDDIVVSQLERFITASLVLGLAAERQGDLFGLVTFSDKVGGFVRAKRGKAHYNACRDALYTLQPETVTPDFDELFSFLRLRLRRRALVVFLTNLDDPVLSESFVKNVELIRRHHLVFVNMIAPKGVGPLFEDESAASVDDLYGRLCGHLRWHDLREVERTLHHRGVSFALLENEALSAQLVTQYVNVKQRQLL